MPYTQMLSNLIFTGHHYKQFIQEFTLYVELEDSLKFQTYNNLQMHNPNAIEYHYDYLTNIYQNTLAASQHFRDRQVSHSDDAIFKYQLAN